jgi:hypothetical protein
VAGVLARPPTPPSLISRQRRGMRILTYEHIDISQAMSDGIVKFGTLNRYIL